MPNYAYSATDGQGVTYQGDLEAEDIVEAAGRIKGMGYTLTNLNAVDARIALEQTQEVATNWTPFSAYSLCSSIRRGA